MARLSAIGRVLSQRNTRIFYGCSLMSWSGLCMQKVATDWLAWELTHSALWVGLLAFCNLGPSVLVSPFAGAVSDRVDRLRLTMVTQLISAAHAATLAVLVLTGLIRIEYMLMLEVILGTSQSFSQPARQSLVPGMVGRADLPGAVALNSLTWNIARSVGPGLGGLLVAAGGVVPGMLINCAGYLIASMTMPMLRLPASIRRGHVPTASVLRDAIDGITYVARHSGMGPLFLYAAVVGVLVRSVPEMLPPFVAGLFGRGPEGLATVSSTIGLAAMVGGTVIAMRGRLSGLCNMALGSGVVMAMAVGGFVASRDFGFAVACAAGMGAATTMHGISVQTLLQTATAGHMIGRVLSLWGMVGRAAPALGTLVYGVSASFAGLQLPVLVGSGLAMLAGALTLRRLPVMVRALEVADAAS